MQTIFETATHKVQIPDGAVVVRTLRVISTEAFFKRLPDVAIDRIIASNSPAAKAFLLRLQVYRAVDLDSPVLNSSVDRMVTTGVLIAAERDDLLA